jgi:peptidoglycan-associated lipoprotein
MQLNKVLKGLMIALPVLAMTACSSSDDATSNSDANQTNAPAQQQQGGNGEQGTDTTVVSPVGGDNGQFTEEEMAAQQKEQAEQKLREESTVFFAFDNSTISASYQDMLAAHASYLSQHPEVKVTVEGHADERGTPEYNIALGERRAEAVSKYIQALGVQADQISIVSYGEEKPLKMGQTEAAYSQNRRAVLVY